MGSTKQNRLTPRTALSDNKHVSRKSSIDSQVVCVAEAVLAKQKYVSPIDILLGLGWLAPSHEAAWRRGMVQNLEQVMQVNLHRISETMHCLRSWANRRGLKPSETAYLARTRGPSRPLQFSVSGDSEIEKRYCTHYVSPELSDAKRRGLAAKLGKAPELVVFNTVRESKCSQCQTDLPSSSFLLMEADRPLCLTCADLDHLIYLPRGDPALTRRARAHSTLSAVVVRFSSVRKRYERQGILVQERALELAEAECLADEKQRASRRAHAALSRDREDRAFVDELAARLRELYPGMPVERANEIAEHTAARGSGRIGCSAAGRALEAEAVRLAVVASIRHRDTRYDELLGRGLPRAEARDMVLPDVEKILDDWAHQRPAS